MRQASFTVVGFLRRIGGNHPALIYGAFVTTLLIGLAQLTSAIVQVAVAPVTNLLELGDEPSTKSRANAPVETASVVLEGDEWLQNLKSNFSSRGATKSSRSNLGNVPETPPSTALLTLFGAPAQPATATDDDDGQAKAGGQSKIYRTMCVRLCDGYYFPISFATTSDRFDDDEKACQRSCSSPAKLYTYRNPGQEPEEMVDIDGRPYNKLVNAFLFRTKFDQACKCNAHAWEQEAMARHRKYAEDATRSKSQKQAAVDSAASAKATKAAKSAKGRTKPEQVTAKPARANGQADKNAGLLPDAAPATSTNATAKFALLNAATVGTTASGLLPAGGAPAKAAKAKPRTGSTARRSSTPTAQQIGKPAPTQQVARGPAPMRLGANPVVAAQRQLVNWQQRAYTAH